MFARGFFFYKHRCPQEPKSTSAEAKADGVTEVKVVADGKSASASTKDTALPATAPTLTRVRCPLFAILMFVPRRVAVIFSKHSRQLCSLTVSCRGSGEGSAFRPFCIDNTDLQGETVIAVCGSCV